MITPMIIIIIIIVSTLSGSGPSGPTGPVGKPEVGQPDPAGNWRYYT